MSNKDVIMAFLERRNAKTPTRDIQHGYYTYKGQTLKTDGNELINYSTRIAYHSEDGVINVNVKKYSSTTSKIQTQLKYLAKQQGFIIIEYEE